VTELRANHEAVIRSLKSNPALDTFFTTKSGKPLPARRAPPALSLPREPIRPIVKELCANSMGAFSGFGRHVANDFLHLESIYPGTPSRLICEGDEEFQQFASSVERYLKSFTEPEFLDKVTSIPNSDNPFTFNETSNKNYMNGYIHVFRRTRARVPRELYVNYCRKGLLDPDHTVGKWIQSYLDIAYINFRIHFCRPKLPC